MGFGWLLLSTLAWAAEAEASSAFISRQTSILDRVISLAGLGVFVGLAWALSENRKAVSWRVVIWGVALQLLFGAVILNETVAGYFYWGVNGTVSQLLNFSDQGAAFIFASIRPHQVADMSGNMVAYGIHDAPLKNVSPPTYTLAFMILPTIIFFSSLMSVLYYLGVMQGVVKGIAWLMVRTLGTSGAESLSAAGNIFVGQTEAPLLIRPFVDKMTRSELMAVMTGGFATVAGGVLGAYVSFLGQIPNIAGHLVIASIISAPAALAIAKIMVPETEESLTAGEVKVEFESNATNVIEAAATGASDGMRLVLNVAAMLIAIVALVAMFNFCLGIIPVRFCDSGATFGYGVQCVAATADSPAVMGEALSLSQVLGWLFFPMALAMGVPFSECTHVGQLLGEKIVLTEFLAYIHLGQLLNPADGVPVLSERSSIIASYALCGFANFASIGIQLGGIGGIAPSRMSDLAALGLRAMFAGVIAACMTGAIAGVFL